jgi:NAD/NADP octopine/nopaline dehydrogenase, alpha-helical domain/NADP oxidoreductase coenzyme F420-dependent
MKTLQPVVAICGGGNAGHALAVTLSQRFKGEIRWLAGSEEKAQLLRDGVFSGDGLQSTGVITARATGVRVISSDPERVITGADLVLIAVPAFAHASVLHRIAPHLKADAWIGALPARGGFDFEAATILDAIQARGRRVIFALQTLPWSTRVQQAGKVVNFGAIKSTVLMATLPAHRAPMIAALLTQLLGTKIVPTKTFLNMTLGNPGQVIHPGLMYGLFHDWCGQRYCAEEVPYFYRDTTDEAGEFIRLLSQDVCAVAQKVESLAGGMLDLSGVLSIHDWLRCSYPGVTRDMSTIAACFRTGPLQHRKAPVAEVAPGLFEPNFAYRYLTEDVPYGLVVTKAIAQLADIGTPAIDTVLRWAQEKLQSSYIAGGMLDEQGVCALPVPQNCGLRTHRDLVRWYAASLQESIAS